MGGQKLGLPLVIRILVLEDEAALRELIQEQLRDAGMVVETLPSADGFEQKLKEFAPNMLLLDQSMPGLKGTEVVQKLRSLVEHSELPVMMLTAHSSEEEKIAAIEGGVDDFLSKPYSARELVVRVQALMRRSLLAQRSGQRILRAGDLRIDLQKQQVFLNDAEIKLTNTELRLMTELVRHTGESVSRDKLREKALGHLDVNDRTIDVHILYLRRKLGKFGDQIETIRGKGYRFTLAS